LRAATLFGSYVRHVTSGSGLFAGANSDVAEFSVAPRAFKTWGARMDAGFVNLTRLGQSSPAIAGPAYRYGFLGAGVSRTLGRNLSMVASYQFNEESFDVAVSTTDHAGLVQRHSGLIGLYWHTRPRRMEYSDTTDDQGQPGPEPN